MTFIYSLSDPRNGDVCYVGKTVRPKTRWSGTQKWASSPAGKWVHDLHLLNLRPIMRIFEQCEDKATAIAREKWWMERMWYRGEPLLNVMHGEGKGAVISLFSPLGDAKREKISAANRRRWASPEAHERMSVALRGRTRSTETRARMSAENRRRYANPEARARMSASQRGKTLSPKHRARISAAVRKHYRQL